MSFNVSKPLFIIFLVILDISIFFLLKSDFEDLTNPYDHLSQIEKKLIHKESTTLGVTPSFNVWLREYIARPYFNKLDQPKKPIVVVESKPKEVSALPVQPVPDVIQPRQVIASPQFEYVGQMVEGNKQTIFLLSPSGPITAKIGEVLDGQWKVENVTSYNLTLIHLASNTSFILNLK